MHASHCLEAPAVPSRRVRNWTVSEPPLILLAGKLSSALTTAVLRAARNSGCKQRLPKWAIMASVGSGEYLSKSCRKSSMISR